ncbi:hypothetical protein NERG_01023 [Nematocida ausubeli]|uniref:Uncharacterized protein n=1 Tax=Nematocida ausubeli (strain ATCC PRA-371 / ERTm2) TaxID=1913371 RepID=H8ZBS4_NEMA1|nr:hypothetical protein NERG_01023 [Nematocida ausubeli]
MYDNATDYYLKKTVSNKLIATVFYVAACTLVYIVVSSIIFFHDLDKTIDLLGDYVGIDIISQLNLSMLYTLIIMQGLLQRDIFQISIATIIVCITNVFNLIGSLWLRFEVFTILYMANNIYIITSGILLIYIVCFTSVLRADLGWFYYKSFGPGYNIRNAIERTTYTFFKLNIQLFISVLVRKYYLEKSVYFLLGEIALYMLVIFIIVIEVGTKKFNIWLRLLLIIILLVITTYYITEITNYRIFLNSPEYPNLVNNVSFVTFQLIRLGIQIALMGIYIFFLFIYTIYQINGWGKNAAIDIKKRRTIR